MTGYKSTLRRGVTSKDAKPAPFLNRFRQTRERAVPGQLQPVGKGWFYGGPFSVKACSHWAQALKQSRWLHMRARRSVPKLPLGESC